MDRQTEVTREQLYEQVWATPMRRLALLYGISDVALAKICKKLNVPKPGLGYWARIEAGHKPTKPPLPPATEKQLRSVVLNRVEHPRTVPAAPSAPRPPAPAVAVPKNLTQAPAVIRELALALNDAEPDRYGRLQVPNVLLVSVDAHNRALRVLSGVIRTLEHRGHAVALERTEAGGKVAMALRVSLGSDDVTLSVEEELDRKPHQLTAKERSDEGKLFRPKPPVYDYFAGGRLRLNAHGSLPRSSWADTRKRRLEDLLGRAIVAIEEEPAARARRDAEIEHERRERQERERQEAEERRKKEEREAQAEHERHLRADLRRMARRWRTAREVGAFLRAFKRSVRDFDRDEEAEAWIRWAEKYVRRIDPLSRPGRVPMKLKPEPPAEDE